jgi:hypothetical protein
MRFRQFFFAFANVPYSIRVCGIPTPAAIWALNSIWTGAVWQWKWIRVFPFFFLHNFFFRLAGNGLAVTAG